MQTTALQSAPAPNEQAAIASLNGLIGEAGHGRQVKIVNMDVREVDGMWIAVAFLEILDDDPQETPEDRPESHRGEGAGHGASEEQDRDFGVDIYYLRGHMSEAERALPDVGENVVPEAEGPPPMQEAMEADAEARRQEIYADAQGGDNDIFGAGSDAGGLSDMVQADFSEAEAAPNPPPPMTVLESSVPEPDRYASLTEKERRRILEEEGIIIPGHDGADRPAPAA